MLEAVQWREKKEREVQKPTPPIIVAIILPSPPMSYPNAPWLPTSVPHHQSRPSLHAFQP